MRGQAGVRRDSMRGQAVTNRLNEDRTESQKELTQIMYNKGKLGRNVGLFWVRMWVYPGFFLGYCGSFLG